MNYGLISLAIILFCSSLGLAIYLAKSSGELAFLKLAHWFSLGLLIISFAMSWAAMVWMTTPDKFTVTIKQWIALVVTIFMAILWWARYAFTIADVADKNSTV